MTQPADGDVAQPAGWAVERHRASAGALHARSFPEPLVRTAWVLEPEAPALVLGSAQRDEIVHRAVADREGVEVVRRRSGGGAVLLRPGEVLWIDLFLPADDPLWRDDIGEAVLWCGEAWRAALLACGALTQPVIHHGGMLHSPWSRLVCFAGVGPGEVTAGAGGAKVVGISQRRTRAGARFQCLAYARWDAVGIAGLLHAPDELAVGDLEAAAAAVDAPLADLAEALLSALPA